MDETTRVYDTRATWWNRWWLAAAAAPVTLLLILAGCALTGRPTTDTGADPAAAAGPTPTASAVVDDAGTADEPGVSAGDDTGAGGSGTSGSGDTGAGPGPGPGDSGEPPYIRDLYHDAYVEPDASGTTQLLTAIVDGHAFDPAGPDEQERVARVSIDWGDGLISPASLGGHGAFGAQHVYPMAYAGQTVTVTVVAYGHDGRTAVRSLDLALPAM
ncbi:MAG: hypothetical protein FWJ70_06525 [Micromonosporaceae bacterium]|jgi:hypothetical protein